MKKAILAHALRFALERHEGQFRKGKDPMPYVFHPISVMQNLIQVGGIEDEEILAAALLHDVLEETGTEYQEIEDRFGSRVAGLVQEVTREEPTEAETEGMNDEEIYELRTERFLKEIAAMSPEALCIKLADRLENLRESALTRPANKHERYLQQTTRILAIIPEDVNKPLWHTVEGWIKKRPAGIAEPCR